jgi:hypothetical protein
MRGLEYVQTTICHEGELGTLQRIAEAETRFGNFQNAVIFNYSMYDLRSKDFKMEMVTVTKYNFTTAVYAVLGNGFFDLVYRAVVYKFALHFDLQAECDSSAPDYSEFSEQEMAFLVSIFVHFNIPETGGAVQKILTVWQYIQASMTLESQLDGSVLQAFFDGECGDEANGPWIAESIRFAVLLAFTETAGMATALDDFEEFMTYLEEQNHHVVLPSYHPRLSEPSEQTEDFILSMRIFTTDPEIVRYGRGEMSWNVFEMDMECVRAFWANEVSDLLFKALTSGERPGLSFDPFKLRNVTNQACNQPIGYPVVVSNVNRSPPKPDSEFTRLPSRPPTDDSPDAA